MLATRSKDSTSLVAVYFQLFQLPYAAKLDMFDPDFSNCHFGRGIFMGNLDAAVVDNIDQVLVLWYSDQGQGLEMVSWLHPPHLPKFSTATGRSMACQTVSPTASTSSSTLRRVLSHLSSYLSSFPRTPVPIRCAGPAETVESISISLRSPFSSPGCPRGENCTGKVGRPARPCDWHHCRPNTARLGPPACCLQLWQAVSTSDPWKPKGQGPRPSGPAGCGGDAGGRALFRDLSPHHVAPCVDPGVVGQLAGGTRAPSQLPCIMRATKPGCKSVIRRGLSFRWRVWRRRVRRGAACLHMHVAVLWPCQGHLAVGKARRGGILSESIGPLQEE